MNEINLSCLTFRSFSLGHDDDCGEPLLRARGAPGTSTMDGWPRCQETRRRPHADATSATRGQDPLVADHAQVDPRVMRARGEPARTADRPATGLQLDPSAKRSKPGCRREGTTFAMVNSDNHP